MSRLSCRTIGGKSVHRAEEFRAARPGKAAERADERIERVAEPGPLTAWRCGDFVQPYFHVMPLRGDAVLIDLPQDVPVVVAELDQ